MDDRMDKEELHEIIDQMGFYDLVYAVRRLAEMAYPEDMFKDCPDVGARFTTKLHEALKELPPK